MGRFLLAALAVITVALGYLMDSPWLLYAGAAFFVLALVALVVLAAARRQRRGQRSDSAARSREEELRSLGPSEPRPRASANPPAPAEGSGAERPWPPHRAQGSAEPEGYDEPEDLELEEAFENEEELARGAAATPEAGPLPERETAAPLPPRETAPEPYRDESRMLEADDDHPLWKTHSPTAFASFLRALWAATEVQTALLAAGESDGTYSLLAIRSHLPNVRPDGRLPADSFLRVAPQERPLTVLTAGDPLTRDLPYYRGGGLVSEVAVLPVATPDGRTLYIAADVPHDQPALTERQRALLLGFADLLRTILAHPPEEATARAVPTRRAIIADEMARSRAEARPLALALVYHAEAERVAEGGEAAVAEAERGLRLLLEDLVHHGRLERFGELMFGAFLHDDVPTLTKWSDRVHARAEEEGIPVAIGMARLGAQRDADALRADAANALAEALVSEDRFAMSGSA
jgi:GAF domain-containing protein